MEDRTRPSLPPMPPQLQAVRRSAPDVEIIALSGDMALSTVDMLREFLEEEVVRSTPCALVVDLRDVVYTDSSAWAVLLGARRELAARGRAIRVVLRADSQPAKTYQMMGLSKALPQEHAL